MTTLARPPLSPSSERRAIHIMGYRTPDGFPTCAIDFPGGKVCPYLRLTRLGTQEVCGVTLDNLRRTDEDKGWLIPCQGCPVWGSDSRSV